MVVWARETISSIETRTTLWSLLQNNDANSNTAVCLNCAYNDSSNTTSTATNEEARAKKAYCKVLHTYTHIHTQMVFLLTAFSYPGGQFCIPKQLVHAV